MHTMRQFSPDNLYCFWDIREIIGALVLNPRVSKMKKKTATVLYQESH